MTTELRSAFPIPLLTVPNGPASTTASLDHASGSSHSNTVTLAIVVGVLSAISSLTFLLLLYTTSRCRRSASSYSSANQRRSAGGADITTAAAHRQPLGRGLDPAVVEHLPLFSFKSLKGNTGGLECAVCLSHYEESDILRLLPSCQHAFHVHCIDQWLVSQSKSCPLCRHEISSQDTLALVDSLMAARRSIEDRSSPLMELSRGAVPRRSQQMYSARARSSDTVHVDILSSPRVSQNDESVKRSVSVDGHGGEISEESRSAACQMPGIEQKSADGGRRSVGSSAKHRRLAHKIVISDVLLQQRWSDVVAPAADVLYLSCDTLFGTSDPMFNTGISNIRLSFSSDGKPRWSTSSATRLSSASEPNEYSTLAQTAAQKQKQVSGQTVGRASSCDPIQGDDSLLPDHSKNFSSDKKSSEKASSSTVVQDAEAPSLVGSDVDLSTSISCGGEKLIKNSASDLSLHRSLSEIRRLDRVSSCISQYSACGSISQELFSSGRLLVGRPPAADVGTAGNESSDQKMRKWLKIAGGTLRRLILRDYGHNRITCTRLDHQTHISYIDQFSQF